MGPPTTAKKHPLNNNRKRPPVPREYYEETMERKRLERKAIARKIYNKNQFIFRLLQNQSKKTEELLKRQAHGPSWYHELSNQQIDVLHGFGDCLKRDYDMGLSKDSRWALKLLGVRTTIPHVVAAKSLIASRLYPARYLKAINNYVRQKYDHCRAMCKNKVAYSLEEKILMSSILYLAFPNLIEKLDYILTEPIADKKLEYIKLPKPKPSKHHYSPYLNRLPEPVLPWTDVEKIKKHNDKVKRQKIRNNLKAKEQLRKRKIVAKNEKIITYGMNVTYPKHSLEKLFYEPPLRKQFKLQDETRKLRAPKESVKKEESTHTSSEETDSSRGGTEKEAPSAKEAKEVSPLPLVSSPQLTEAEETSDSDYLESITQSPAFASEVDPSNVNDSQTIPNGWLIDETSESDVSVGSIFSNLLDTDSTAEYENETLDFDSTTGEHDSEVDRDVNITKVQSDPNALPEMHEMEKLVWQQVSEMIYGKCSDDRMSIEAESTSYETSWPIENDSPSMIGLFDEGGDEFDEVGDEFDEGGYEFDKGNEMEESSSFTLSKTIESVEDLTSVESVEEASSEVLNENSSIIVAEILDEIRKLPPWQQLKVALKCLCIMCDPVAGFPDLIELNRLQRWYELRLNVNRRATEQLKQNMMKDSLVAWNTPRRKLGTIAIPSNPVPLKSKGKKITWDQKNHIKHKAEKVAARYKVKLKHLAVNNASELYPSMQNDYFKNRLTKRFRKTFHDYLPAKEQECYFR